MKSTLRMLVLLAPVMLSGCYMLQSKENHETITKSYNFNYELHGAEEINLSQVFDDKQNTYFVFSSEPAYKPQVTLPGQTDLIPVKHTGNYWIVSDIYQNLQISVGSNIVPVTNKAYVAPAKTAAAAAPQSKKTTKK